MSSDKLKPVYDQYLREMNSIMKDSKRILRRWERISEAIRNKDQTILKSFHFSFAEGEILLGQALAQFLRKPDCGEYKVDPSYVIACYSLLSDWSHAKPKKTLTMFIHYVVDGYTERYRRENPGLVKCKKGCSFCCYQQVNISSIEGELIDEYLKKNPRALFSPEHLTRQRSWPKSFQGLDWEKNFPVEQRRCPFLDSTGLCGIYPVRPVACRNHRSVADPSFCDPFENPGMVVASPNQLEIALLIEVLLSLSESGPLAHMINKRV